MGSLPLRQSEAAKWTKAAWGATALAGAAAVIIFVMPKSGRSLNLEPGDAQTAQTPEKQRKHPTDDLGAQNWSTLTGSMLTLESSQPELEQWRRMEDKRKADAAALAAQNQPEGESDGSVNSPNSPFPPTWRYVGLMWNGQKPLAIVEIDSKQRIVREGEKPIEQDNFVVESIDAQKIVLSRGKNRYELKREESRLGIQLSNAGAEVDPNQGVFGDPSGASRRAPRVRPNSPQNSPRNNHR